jgi:molybdopterin-guanine dinucleotide biosynthesis protein A
MTSLAGLILCGGRSRRMGSEKALIPVEGVALVLRVAERVGRAADPVILAPGRPGRLGLRGLPYPEVADVVASAGPLAGVVAGLAASPHPLMAVVAVDLPFASPELLRRLAELYEGEDAVVPVSSSGPEPLHAVYSRESLPLLRAALSQRRLALRPVLEGLRVRWVEDPEWRVSDPSGRFAINLNRAEDLSLLG